MKQHPIYNHLIVYEDGRIYSTKSNRFLKTLTHKNGYEVFHTKLNGRNGKGKLLRVHRLVAEVYVQNPYDKPFVNHKDGVKKNNHSSNLEWVTTKENMIHAKTLGLLNLKTRETCGQAKLTNEQMEYIQSVYTPRHKEFGSRALSKKFNVTHSTLYRLGLTGGPPRTRTVMPFGVPS